MQVQPLSQAPRGAILIDEKQAAQLLSVSIGMLRKDRLGERRIPVVRIGHAVRYSPAALEQFANGGPQ